MSNINWKLIAFCVALFWFVYSAPTEGWLTEILTASSTVSSNADTF